MSQFSTAASMEKTGAGVVQLSGNNTYTGSNTISGGTFIAASPAALGPKEVPLSITALCLLWTAALPLAMYSVLNSSQPWCASIVERQQHLEWPIACPNRPDQRQLHQLAVANTRPGQRRGRANQARPRHTAIRLQLHQLAKHLCRNHHHFEE